MCVPQLAETEISATLHFSVRNLRIQRQELQEVMALGKAPRMQTTGRLQKKHVVETIQ